MVESVVYGRLGVTLQRVTSQGDCVVRSLEVVEDKPKPKMASQPLLDAANRLASACTGSLVPQLSSPPLTT